MLAMNVEGLVLSDERLHIAQVSYANRQDEKTAHDRALNVSTIHCSAHAALASFNVPTVSLPANENGLCPISGLLGLIGNANKPSS